MDEVAVDDACNTGLVLRLGCTGETNTVSIIHRRRRRRDSSMKSEPSVLTPMLPGPSLTLSLSDTAYRQSPAEADDQLSASFLKVKKEADAGSEETEKLSPRGSDDEDEGGYRKKLRLTKEQSALLEERFREHSTINPRQKLALAKQLNLRPRQVEVWFQNRRARTKLKQTEADCEFLRRCCETLTNENRRLHRELQELKALKLAATATPLYMQLPAATFTACTSCERLVDAGGDGSKAAALTAATTAAVVTKKTLFFNPFTHSAAC